MKKVILLILCSLSLTCFSVKRNVPGTYSTIQSALNACNFGDTVFVQPGTYAEHVIWPNTDYLKLISAGDSSNTIIDATLNGRCITISPPVGAIDSTIVIKGFKLTRGYSDTTSFFGVAIYASNAQIKLIDLAICRNSVNALNGSIYGQYSGGICYFNVLSVILNSAIYCNTVTCNNASINGGIIKTQNINYVNNMIFKNQVNTTCNSNTLHSGLILYISPYYTNNILDKASITDNLISINSTTASGSVSGGIIQIGQSSTLLNKVSNLLIANNSFTISSNNTVQGLLFFSSLYAIAFTNIIHSTFANNFVIGNPVISTISVFISGYYPSTSTPCTVCSRAGTIINSIMWNPSINGTKEVDFANFSGPTGGTTTLSVINSDVNSYTAGVNSINQNPQFISSTNFHLQNTSPCINTGDSATKVPLDLDGNPRPINIFPDMGCYEFGSSSTAIYETNLNTSSFQIYPNPNSGEFVLRSKHSSDNSIFEIYTINGQMIEKKEISEENTSINLKEFSNGLYFLKISNKERASEVIKIIKQ